MGKKRDLSVFDAIEELETQDRLADGKRQKKTIADQKRAVQVQSQTKIYNHLVESRILLQRAVTHVKNQDASDVNDQSSSSSEQPVAFRDKCNVLLEKLLLARNQLAGKKDDQDKYKNMLDSSSSSELHDVLQNEYEEHKEQWKEILNQRHKSLRLHSGATAKSQFRVMDSSFWEQVEATIEYEEIRAKNDEKNKHGADFDDSKLYQQLLKEFVSNSVHAGTGEAATASAERLRATKQKQNSVKKDVDRRASKGRKIRYKEIPKLVNFTFPLSRPNSSNLNQDEYFQSLFGGVGTGSSNKN
mmetsp:Transcript_28012/g.46348  ORF Transcript_28012/g.46348 Transcript_28012/m.46348 type:complete len:301 (-) Transcript_28012:51-953(-)